jgi:anti-sigma-K factor RskA
MPREHTPEHAVQNFEGEYDIIHARNVSTRRCNKDCLNFWFIGAVMISIVVVCVVMLAVNGTTDPGAPYWQTLLTFAIGVMVPNPKYKSSLKIKAR